MTSSTAAPGSPARGVAFRYEGYDLDPAAGRLTCRFSLDGRQFAEIVTYSGLTAGDGAQWDDPAVDAAARWVFLLAGVLGVTPAWLIAGLGKAPDSEACDDDRDGLREQLALVKKLHEQTGKAIAALEMELNRVQQNTR